MTKYPFVDTSVRPEWAVDVQRNRREDLVGDRAPRFDTEADARAYAARVCGEGVEEEEPGLFIGPWLYNLQGVRSDRVVARVRRVGGP